MKRIATHTMVFLLASLFLLSFTGIRMLIHHCLGCETTDIALFAFAYDDCDATHHTHAGSATCHFPASDDHRHGCCEAHDEAHEDACGNCCETEVRYLKNDYQVPQEKSEPRLTPVMVAVLTPFLIPSEEDQALPGMLDGHSSNSGPPRPVGREFVIYTHRLKIS